MREFAMQRLRLEECDGGRPALRVYDDATGTPIRPGSTVQGHPTIGIGRALDTNGITAGEAEALFASDVARAEAGCAAVLPWWGRLDPVRQDVLVDMAFQLGIGGLQDFKVMCAEIGVAITEGPASPHWQAAAQAGLDSAWAREMGRFGSPRARRLMAVLASGSDDAAEAVS